MRVSFDVRDESYEAEIYRVDKPEGEKLEICEAWVRGPGSNHVKGTFKLTDTALALAEEKAAQEGGSMDEWLARGCVGSMIAELVIRPLRSGFSFVVDHRWIRHNPSWDIRRLSSAGSP